MVETTKIEHSAFLNECSILVVLTIQIFISQPTVTPTGFQPTAFMTGLQLSLSNMVWDNEADRHPTVRPACDEPERTFINEGFS